MKLVDEPRIPAHPYPELRAVLERFVTETQAILGANLCGIYLVGSLASGDFDRDSDVDFLVVIDQELTDATANTLQTIQKAIQGLDCYPARHLEGSYIRLCDLTEWKTVGEKPIWYFDNGSTVIEHSTHDNQWHVRWILRERGITLLGPPPESLLPPIPREALAHEITTQMQHMLEEFTHAMHGPLNFWTSRFGQSFVVLTSCRMLHTLHTGTVQSKKVAVNWAKQVVEPHWRSFLEQAWHDRQGVRFGVKIGQRTDQAVLEKTCEFIQYTVTHRDQLTTGRDHGLPVLVE